MQSHASVVTKQCAAESTHFSWISSPVQPLLMYTFGSGGPV